MRQFTTPEQTAKLIELGFEKPKSEVKAEQAGDYAWYNPAYSIGELIEMLPSYVEWKGNYYYLQIKTECTYSCDVSYEPTQNDKAKILPVYDGGSRLIDILYNVLINLAALKDELTDTGGHDEYNQGEVLSQVFKLKEEGVI